MHPAKPLDGVTIGYFGHYDPDYPRHRVLIKALRRAGAEIAEMNDRSRGLARWRALFAKAMRCHFDFMIVPFPSHTDMPVARVVCALKRTPLIFDPLVSLYDTVLDRTSIHPRSLAARKAYWIDKMACQLADVLVLESRSSMLFFAETLAVKQSKFRQLSVGADDAILRPCPEPPHHPFTVFFTGTFIPLHGIEVIISAAKIMEQRGEDVRFVIVGTGQTYAKIRAMASDLAVVNVHFEPPVRYEQLSRLISESHLCLGIFGTSPKTQHGIPSKIFFALATRRAVVTGDTAPMREVFTHGENIWLCPAGNAAALADAIIALKGEPSLRAKIASQGHELFARKFSVDAIMRDAVSIVQELGAAKAVKGVRQRTLTCHEPFARGDE